jgi:hypothetical protein
MSNPIDLPNLEEIKEMDRQRSEAEEALEIYDHHVKCQKCSIWVPIIQSNKPSITRVERLNSRIKFIEEHPHYCFYSTKKEREDGLNKLKAERLELLEGDAKADRSRLPLYSSPITRYKYVCSSCWDRASRYSRYKPKYLTH